jgi:GNAT superfamily N-acetyltransferase
MSRDVAPPVPAYGGWHIDVGLPDQQERYVFAAVSDDVRRASTEIDEQHRFLKVCAEPEALRNHLAAGWVLRSQGFFMDWPGLSAGRYRPAAHYDLSVVNVRQDVWTIEASTRGSIAARGSVLIVDRLAIFDRIETDASHRRKGLGSAIMAQLASIAVIERATHGLLVATPDGRALYETMGWRLHSPYSTAVRAEI